MWIYPHILYYSCIFNVLFFYLSFNARHLRDNLQRKAVFLFIKKFKSSFYFYLFIFLQVSHSAKDDMSFWKTQWGNDLWEAHGSQRSAGFIILKDNYPGEIIDLIHLIDETVILINILVQRILLSLLYWKRKHNFG